MMYKEKMSGKADITMGTIVTIIIILLGFAIVLFFYFQLTGGGFWGGMVNREVCHQSVIYRGTLPSFAGAKDFIPLKCKTEKFCITADSRGECEDFESSKGINRVKVKNKEQIERFIAKDILDCWETMGEGKISIFSQWLAESYGIGDVYPSCVICSRIAFDKESLEKKGINLDEINLMNYMMTHKVPSKDISYTQFLAGEGGKISTINSADFYINPVLEEGGEITVLGEQMKIEVIEENIPESETDELAVMFMQVSSPNGWEVFKNTLSIVGVGAAGSFVVMPKVIGRAVVNVPTLITLTLAGIYQQYSVSENRAVTAGYCSDISVGEEARQGCSVVRTVNYDFESISQYCKIIESVS